MLSVAIKKSFRGFSLDVSFETGACALALLGASGCGKSMTLKCVAGIIKPDSGRIVLNGRTLYDSEKGINLSPQKRNTGLLFQNYALFPNMTVAENIAAGLRRSPLVGKKSRLDELLRMFFLTEQRLHYPAQLSGGQQQRAALARILASEPELIMLDEPLSALDSFLRWQLEQELIGIIEKFSGPVLYVSHNRGEVYRICRAVCVINNGCSAAVTDTRRFFASPQTRSAALLSGCKNFSRAKKISQTGVFALDWNCELECSPGLEYPSVPDDLRYVGVRAHRLSLTQKRNKIKCKVEKIIEDLFSVILVILPLGDNSGAAAREIRMELPKTEAADIRAGDVIEAGIAPEDILLLK